MANWHKLSLVSALTLIVPTVLAGCGGMSAEDGKGAGGSSGSPSGGATAALGGSSSQGGSANGGQAQGGAVSCGELSKQYATALEEALSCNPALSVDQCTQKVAVGLACACPGFVNPSNAEAMAELVTLHFAYRDQNCAGGVVCGPCFEPIRAFCSPAGRCEPAVTTTTGKGCKVNGVVYPDGAQGIQDPTSCNKCSCLDGMLACTEIACPTCPAGTAPGSQCVECGPAGGCWVYGYGCVPKCSAPRDCGEGKTCQDGLCLDLLFCL